MYIPIGSIIPPIVIVDSTNISPIVSPESSSITVIYIVRAIYRREVVISIRRVSKL